MKKLSLITAALCTLLLNANLHAIEFEIQNICEESPYLSKNIKINGPTNAGDITIQVLNDWNVPYIGSVDSITSMLGTITGLDSYEVISDTEMRIYGWCYEVDGLQPDVLMSEYMVNPAVHSKIYWYYGSAHYLEGEWLSYCDPVYKLKPDFICK